MKRTRRLRRLLKLAIRNSFERWTWPAMVAGFYMQAASN
jgi:hypothetical protein